MKLIVDKNSRNEITVGLTWGRHQFKPLYKGNDYVKAFSVINDYRKSKINEIENMTKVCFDKLSKLVNTESDWIIDYNGVGDVMKVEDFLQDVKNGCLTPYDGYGKLLLTSQTDFKTRTKKLVEIFPILLYERKVKLSEAPGDYLSLEDAIDKLKIEYIVWFNK